MSGKDVRRFRYSRSGMKIYIACLVAAFGGVSIYLLLWYRREGWVGAVLFFASCFFLFLLLFANYCLVLSDIETDADSISWVIFGRRWKELKWADIDHIRVSSGWAWGTYSPRKIYSIYPSKRRRLYFLRNGVIFFYGDIRGAIELKNIVKTEARSRKIPVEDPGSDL
jgi:hypothetical protein